ncbi:MAG: methylamine utilization protein [Caulobacterales bacterium 68-7]|nr:methylamine utilization protein [Caulobacterales bacterium]OJU11004.1 MAG: methylamine utilization protein [Caulobacterales bacterium 68-7]
MRLKSLIAVLAVLASPTLAKAADLVVTVRDAAGQPVKDAVAMLRTGAPAGQPVKFTWPYRVSQHDISFDPFVLVVPVGSNVSFPNNDKVRHHVYSFSPTKKFQLKLYGREEDRSVLFDKAGVVALGCNIHDQMAAFVVVVDTPYAGKTDASGQVTLRGAPAGAAKLTVWHPFMKTAGNQTLRTVNVGANGGREAFTVDLRPAPPTMTMH